MIQTQHRFFPSALVFATALVVTVGGAGVLLDRKSSQEVPASQASTQLARELTVHGSSPEVKRVASWVITANDHAGHPFLIIDQARSRLFAFSGQGRLVGSTPVAPSVAWADPPAPAGRFVADGWRSARSGGMVWANVGRALSLRVTTQGTPARRLASTAASMLEPREREAEIEDERPAGSFQVASEFYRQHLHALRHQASVAYVLPDTPPLRRSTASYAAAHNPRSFS